MGPQPLAQRHDARFRGSKELVATRCEKVQWGARNAIEVYLSHHPETCHQRRIGRWRKPLETGRSTQTKFASGRTSRLLFGYEVSRGGGPGRAFHPLSGLVATSHKSSKYKDGRIGGQTGRSQLSGPVGSGRRSASGLTRAHFSWPIFVARPAMVVGFVSATAVGLDKSAGRKRCRLHGGSAGAPRGSRNGNYRRGDWTTEAIEERRWLRSLVRAFAKTGTGR